MNTGNSSVRKLRDIIYLMIGLAIYALTRKTPQFAYQALIRVFCQTGGRANDALSSFISRIAPPLDFGHAQGILGDCQEQELADLVRTIETYGYYVAPNRLPGDVCARLVDYARSSECIIRLSEDGPSGDRQAERAVYDPTCPRGVRYDFTQQQVINIPDVQALLADASLLALAQAYLRARPIADVSSMWWHTAYSDQPDAEAAQFYHFDMDRIKWLKIFVYLTEVSPDNGPHCFIEGSHRTGEIPQQLLSKGYVRLTDAEVLQHYAPQRLKEFNAPAGTVIVEDTRGLHKGKAVHRGDRLMLQFQFSNSMFGGACPPSRFEGFARPDVAAFVKKHPSVYANFLA
jgi:hypothetical protein